MLFYTRQETWKKLNVGAEKKLFARFARKKILKQRLFQRQFAVKFGTSFAFAYSYLENCPKFVLY